MDWRLTFGVVAGLIQVGSFVPYIKDILKGAARPNLVSWILWTLSTSIISAAQIIAGPSWSLVLPLSATVMTLVVTILAAIGYGYRKIGVIEVACFLCSVSALALWYVTKEPLVALGFAISSDAFAYIPTIAKAHRDPFSETPLLWFLLAIAGGLSALSATVTNAANLVFPLYYLFINAIAWAVIFSGQRVTKPLR